MLPTPTQFKTCKEFFEFFSQSMKKEVNGIEEESYVPGHQLQSFARNFLNRMGFGFHNGGDNKGKVDPDHLKPPISTLPKDQLAIAIKLVDEMDINWTLPNPLIVRDLEGRTTTYSNKWEAMHARISQSIKKGTDPQKFQNLMSKVRALYNGIEDADATKIGAGAFKSGVIDPVIEANKDNRLVIAGRSNTNFLEGRDELNVSLEELEEEAGDVPNPIAVEIHRYLDKGGLIETRLAQKRDAHSTYHQENAVLDGNRTKITENNNAKGGNDPTKWNIADWNAYIATKPKDLAEVQQRQAQLAVYRTAIAQLGEDIKQSHENTVNPAIKRLSNDPSVPASEHLDEKRAADALIQKRDSQVLAELQKLEEAAKKAAEKLEVLEEDLRNAQDLSFWKLIRATHAKNTGSSNPLKFDDKNPLKATLIVGPNETLTYILHEKPQPERKPRASFSGSASATRPAASSAASVNGVECKGGFPNKGKDALYNGLTIEHTKDGVTRVYKMETVSEFTGVVKISVPAGSPRDPFAEAVNIQRMFVSQSVHTGNSHMNIGLNNVEVAARLMLLAEAVRDANIKTPDGKLPLVASVSLGVTIPPEVIARVRQEESAKIQAEVEKVKILYVPSAAAANATEEYNRIVTLEEGAPQPTSAEPNTIVFHKQEDTITAFCIKDGKFISEPVEKGSIPNLMTKLKFESGWKTSKIDDAEVAREIALICGIVKPKPKPRL